MPIQPKQVEGSGQVGGPVTTTDATPTALYSFALATGFDVLHDFTLHARVTSGPQAGNSWCYRANALVLNPTGTPALTTAVDPMQETYYADETSSLLTPAIVSFVFRADA